MNAVFDSPSIKETEEYIDLPEFSASDQEAVLSQVTAPEALISSCLTERDLKRFKWDGSVLGALELDADKAIQRGIRSRFFKDLAPLHFNSATIGIPLKIAARAAWKVASALMLCKHNNDFVQAEKLISSVSLRAFQELCAYYRLQSSQCECLFADNSTMALFQFIAASGIDPGSRFVSFFDTGKTLPSALAGTNPATLAHNFKPMLDVWRNTEQQPRHTANLGPYQVQLLHHFTHRCKTDSEITHEAAACVSASQARLVVIPTVTSSGRILPVESICSRLQAMPLRQRPIIILDDSQGIGRLLPERYNFDNFLSISDGVLLTGGKVLGALLGTGALIMRPGTLPVEAAHLKRVNSVIPLSRYGFYCMDSKRMEVFNAHATGIALTPEIASLSAALHRIPHSASLSALLHTLYITITDQLRELPQVPLLREDSAHGHFEESIIAFYFTEASHTGVGLKRALAAASSVKTEWCQYPVSLAAIITADGREYVRLALDPAQVLFDKSYPAKIKEALDRIKRFLAQVH